MIHDMVDISELMADEDWQVLMNYLPPGKDPFVPDLTIAPDGEPYLFRWHVIPHNSLANVYLHVQVKSDPYRPLHDHPWINTSTILAGGYDEIFCEWPDGAANRGLSISRQLRKGDTVHRRAEAAHRLILPPSIPYTISLFSTGAKRRDWGFWYPDGWHHNARHLAMRNGAALSDLQAKLKRLPLNHPARDRGMAPSSLIKPRH